MKTEPPTLTNSSEAEQQRRDSSVPPLSNASSVIEKVKSFFTSPFQSGPTSSTRISPTSHKNLKSTIEAHKSDQSEFSITTKVEQSSTISSQSDTLDSNVSFGFGANLPEHKSIHSNSQEAAVEDASTPTASVNPNFNSPHSPQLHDCVTPKIENVEETVGKMIGFSPVNRNISSGLKSISNDIPSKNLNTAKSLFEKSKIKSKAFSNGETFSKIQKKSDSFQKSAKNPLLLCMFYLSDIVLFLRNILELGN